MGEKKIPLITLAVSAILALSLLSFANQAFADIFYYVTSGSCNSASTAQLSNQALSTHNIFVGEKIVNTNSILFDKTIDSMSIKVRNPSGATAGSFYAGVWNATVTPTELNAKKLFGSALVTEAGTSYTDFTFQLTNDVYVTQVGDAIGIFYDDGSTSIFLCNVNGDPTDGSNTINNRFRNSDDTWQDTATTDMWGSIFFSTGSVAPSSNRCPTGTVLDCVGSATAFTGFTSGKNVTDVTVVITDGLGLTNCGDSPDHETCGSGLFTFLFLLLLSEFFALVGYLTFTRKANAEVKIMDIGLLILMIGFVDLAIGFYLNWIPDVIFYSMVVLIAGFMAFGLISRLRGG